jgi:hypothetical protein
MRSATRASAVVLAALALAGCGDDEDADAPTDAVFSGVVALGTTQDVKCEPVGIEIRGDAVVACSFEEERNDLGVMRAVDRCFVIREGVLIDVTRQVPVGTACGVSAP